MLGMRLLVAATVCQVTRFVGGYAPIAQLDKSNRFLPGRLRVRILLGVLNAPGSIPGSGAKNRVRVKKCRARPTPPKGEGVDLRR